MGIEDQIRQRTRDFGLAVIRMVEKLPRTRTADVIAKQLLRCGTSVGPNYRASCRAKSKADFIAKMRIVEEEADESLYWMDLLVASRTVEEEEVSPLMNEGNQILAITVASIKTARSRL